MTIMTTSLPATRIITIRVTTRDNSRDLSTTTTTINYYYQLLLLTIKVTTRVITRLLLSTTILQTKQH